MICNRCHRPAKLASDESGDWFCYRCGCWVHLNSEPKRRDTEPAPALPKVEPLRSDYMKAEIVMPPSNPDEWIVTTAGEAFGKGYFGLPPDMPVQVRKPADWKAMALQSRVNDPLPEFSKALNAAVCSQWKKQERELAGYLFTEVLRIADGYCVHALACEVKEHEVVFHTDCSGLAHDAIARVVGFNTGTLRLVSK